MRPILEYGSTVWDPHCNGLNDELEKVQKRAARFVTRNYSYETGSMTGILEELKWETLQKRRKDNNQIKSNQTRMMFIKHYAPNRCLCIKVAKSTMFN